MEGKILSFLLTILLVTFVKCKVVKRSIQNQSLEHKVFIDAQSSMESQESYEYETSCHHGCPRILDPICAVDELHPKEYKYFHNQCLMEYDNCRQSRAWKATQMLLCIEDIDPVVRDDCMRACPMIYDPVCASDGKNYEIFGNQCSFGMENCLASGKWLEVRSEQCGL